MPLQHPNGDYSFRMSRVAWERLKAMALFQDVREHQESDGMVYLGTPSWERWSRIDSAVQLRQTAAQRRGSPIDPETAFEELADIASGG